MVSSPRTLVAAPSRQRVAELDLTDAASNGFAASSPFADYNMPHMRASPRNFNKAVRRVYTRRERMFDRATPNKLMGERLEVSEEMPPAELHPAREAALTHLSRAYAMAGYAQAALCVVVSAVLVAFIISFSRGMLADVSRKIRHRAGDAVRSSVECRRKFDENGCASAHRLTPSLAGLCSEWNECIAMGGFAERDAVSATVWAEAVAETFNAFAERISSTSVVIGITCSVILLFFMSSAAFGFMHRRLVDDRLSAPPPSPVPVAVTHIGDKDQLLRSQTNSLRPRAISFDPNISPMTTVVKAS